MRIDDPARRESADQAGDADLAEIRIDLDLGEHSAMGMHGIGGLRRRVRGALAAGFDLIQAGAPEDVARIKRSYTGEYLKAVLARGAKAARKRRVAAE